MFYSHLNIKNYIILIVLTLLLNGCGEKTQTDALEEAHSWVNHLDVNLTLIAEKGYGDKKRLSEILGVYWKFYHYGTQDERNNIKTRVKPFYQYTHKKSYLNLAALNDKQFRKNSMSFLRVMWIFKNMNFDIGYLIQAFNTIKPRMDAHLVSRGPWQKSMFASYYDFFGFKKPKSILNTNRMTGLIGSELPLSKYNTMYSYQLTHQVFVAFNYGMKRNQTRFNAKELVYLKRTLPTLVHHYRKKKNWDLLSELLTCMIYLNHTENKTFTSAYNALLKAQNKNGSWGDYERARKKYGDFVDVKYYLHTTGVAIETLIEKIKGKWNSKRD